MSGPLRGAVRQRPGRHRSHRALVDAVVLALVPAVAQAGVDVTIAVNLLGRQALRTWPGTAGPDRARARP